MKKSFLMSTLNLQSCDLWSLHAFISSAVYKKAWALLALYYNSPSSSWRLLLDSPLMDPLYQTKQTHSFKPSSLSICPKPKYLMVYFTKPSTAFWGCILCHHPCYWWIYWTVLALLSNPWALCCWLLPWSWAIGYYLFSLVAQPIFSSSKSSFVESMFLQFPDKSDISPHSPRLLHPCHQSFRRRKESGFLNTES